MSIVIGSLQARGKAVASPQNIFCLVSFHFDTHHFLLVSLCKTYLPPPPSLGKGMLLNGKNLHSQQLCPHSCWGRETAGKAARSPPLPPFSQSLTHTQTHIKCQSESIFEHDQYR